jgi:predicted acetyltransferase
MSVVALETPSERLRASFIDMAREFSEHGNARYVPDAEDFDGFLLRIRDEEEGRQPAPGSVPISRFWLVQDRRILGTSRLRHRLTPQLEQEGGNVGYDIRPSDRRKGFGTILLRLTLELAAARGLARVLVTCDADNLGSIRVIERNGGSLESEVLSHDRAKTVRRYWIRLAPPDGARPPIGPR